MEGKLKYSNEEMDILDEFVRNNCQMVSLSQCTIIALTNNTKHINTDTKYV